MLPNVGPKKSSLAGYPKQVPVLLRRQGLPVLLLIARATKARLLPEGLVPRQRPHVASKSANPARSTVVVMVRTQSMNIIMFDELLFKNIHQQ